MKIKWGKYFGPSTLVAAAFIGPGTLTTCTLVGVKTGLDLIWVLVAAIIATIVLQEMSARLGYATQSGLGEAFRVRFVHPVSKALVFFLVIGAILIGNAAYEAGNISGGILGAELIFGTTSLWPIILGAMCFALIYFGGYKWVEKFLIAMVIMMSLCFGLTAIIIQPDLGEILHGLTPKIPDSDQILLILGLIGTTIVPYNLFLHASTISKKWKPEANLKDIRNENRVAIILGGIISILVVITAGSLEGGQNSVSNAQDLALQLEPAFGSFSKWLMGIGLMAAGISSALTAPLAAAYAAKGLFGWNAGEEDRRFKLTWMIILFIGIAVAMTDVDRILIIYFAQITNAILLPFIAIFLLYVANSKKLMKLNTNGLFSNVLGGVIILICLLLSLKTLNGIFNLWQ